MSADFVAENSKPPMAIRFGIEHQSVVEKLYAMLQLMTMHHLGVFHENRL
jgi:hypothetical protein